MTVVMQLCNWIEDSGSEAICTDAADDMVCFAQGLVVWCLVSFLLPPFIYLTLDVCIMYPLLFKEQGPQSDPLQKEPSAAAQQEPGVSVWKELMLLSEHIGSCSYKKSL